MDEQQIDAMREDVRGAEADVRAGEARLASLEERMACAHRMLLLDCDRLEHYRRQLIEAEKEMAHGTKTAACPACSGGSGHLCAACRLLKECLQEEQVKAEKEMAR
jgi:hypothetical protein